MSLEEENIEEQPAPPSADHYDLALKFLSNPKVFGLPDERKVEFLAKKGIDRAVIERALQESSEGARYCPFNKKLFPKGAVRPAEKGGFFSFIWKLIKLTSGLALGAYLVKKFVWHRLADYFQLDGKIPMPGHNRLAADRRRVSPPELPHHSNNEVLMKKMDSIVATLQDVVARQEAVSESLALLLKTRQIAGQGNNSGEQAEVVQQSNERMLAEIADLKALLVSPNRFPPMPSSTYVPGSAPSGRMGAPNRPQVVRKTSTSESKQSTPHSYTNQQQQQQQSDISSAGKTNEPNTAGENSPAVRAEAA